MLRSLPRLQRLLFAGFTALFTAALALSVVPPAFADCTPPSYATGVHQPVGADAATYTYNCTTGLWENAYYTYDPATGQYSPVTPPTYTYNPSTGLYDYTVWIYDSPTGNYDPVTKSVATPPDGANVVGAPDPPAGSESISNTGDNSTNSIDNNLGGTSQINGTGDGSTNGITGSGDTTTNLANGTTAGVNNIITGTATTGNALLLANTLAGDSTSGNAQDLANVVNLLQSSTNALGGDTTTFVANINGDVNGDFLVDPAGLGAVQPASTTANPGNNNLNINDQTSAAINNDINLGATSGDATVSDNTQAGNATTGNAQAIADVVNLIDSAITAGRSFVGVININGNLNGNIVIPPELFNQLVASNVPTVDISLTGADSTNTINNQTGNNTNVTNTDNAGITNNVTAGATSGSATETDNTVGGNATTGNAATHITAFNLTGSQVIGANDLLVFVNVLGQWVGMIIGAPPGATAAEFGGGITGSNGTGVNTTNVNDTNNQQINNNINVNAQSGDASVTGNTKAGDAHSGNADAAVNLLNVADSSLSLSGWFGILFINVFGNWNGNFGIYSAAAPVAGSPAAPAFADVTSSGPPPVFRFVPHDTGAGVGVGSSALVTSAGTVLAAHIGQSHLPASVVTSPHRSLALANALIAAAVILFILADAFLTYRREHRIKPTA